MKKLKIAMIFAGNPYKQGGKFNHVFERIKEFHKRDNIIVDVFLIQKTYSFLFSTLRNVQIKKEETTIIDGVTIKNLWVKETVIEYFITYKLGSKAIMGNSQIKKFIPLFEDYDMISTNDLLSSYLALLIKKKYHIPFSITWHGSDINVYPYRSKKTFQLIKKLLIGADNNFFVSKYLLQNSNRIANTKNKRHLYIGPNDNFYKYSEKRKEKIRQSLAIQTKYTVGFVGNIVAIKNVLLLPEIFKYIQERINPISFIIAGSGSQLELLKRKAEEYEINNISFLGRVKPDHIPEIMNILNVLLLPSKEEGLGLVSLEAQKCGANVVGSKIGGIPETICPNNCFPLNEKFVQNIAERVIKILKYNEKPEELPSEFSLIKAINKEIITYSKITRA